MITKKLHARIGAVGTAVLAVAVVAIGIGPAMADPTSYSYTGTLGASNTDSYPIALQAGDWVVAREICADVDGSRPLDPHLYVQDSDAHSIASDDDGGSPACNSFRSSCVQFTVPSDGSYSFIADQAASSGGPYQLTVDVNGSDLCYTQPATVTSAASASTPVGQPFSFTATAAGAPAATVDWTSVDVPGVTASGDTVSGTPSVAGVYHLTATATNSQGSNDQDFELTVTTPAVFTSGTTAPGVVDTPFSFDFNADGVPAPAISIDPASLPAWLTADGGSLSGTPTATGTYVVTATAQGAGDPVTSELTITVDPATFTSAPAPTISGTLKVGETLTADAGQIAPTPADVTYQWQAGGVDIVGATDPIYTLTPAERHAVMTVRVTATRPGYDDAAATSPATTAVATELAPSLTLTTDPTSVRLGQHARLTWTTEEATSLTASGSWTGDEPSNGWADVTPKAVGTSTYMLSATNENGTTVAVVPVRVELPATHLRVSTATNVVTGNELRVRAGGLAAGEPYTVRIAGTAVGTGRAAENGTVNQLVLVPNLKDGVRSVTVTGAFADRVGGTQVRVVGTMSVTMAHRTVRASDPQALTVRHLLPREQVKVSYRGHVITGRANTHGVFRTPLTVGTSWGGFAVTATALRSHQHASTQFRVVIRCLDRSWNCR